MQNNLRLQHICPYCDIGIFQSCEESQGGGIRCSNMPLKDKMERQHWVLIHFERPSRFHWRVTDRPRNLTQKAAPQVKPWPKRKRPALDMTDLILQMQKESAADMPGIQNTPVPVHLLQFRCQRKLAK